MVPTGTPMTIPAGTFVTLTQSLGGSFTVVVEGNMARISGSDADAIGLTAELPVFDEADAQPGQISEAHVWHALSSVYDPEIPVNIVDLGLIYSVSVDQTGAAVAVEMTLTAPGCGMGPVLVEEVKDRILLVPDVKTVEVELIFDPPWSRDMMTEEAQLQLGVF